MLSAYINETTLYNNVIIPANKVATVFGKTELRKYISEQINRGNLVRIKKRGNNSSELTSPIKAHYVSDKLVLIVIIRTTLRNMQR